MKDGDDVQWTVAEEADGVAFRWGHSGEDLVAEWRGALSLRASRSGELKDIRPAPGMHPDLVEKMRRGVVAAFLRAQRQKHSLHASAVAWHDRALVCVGASGLGKSTMAERMCHRAGARLLSDDMAPIDIVAGVGPVLAPSESAVWLARDDSGAKRPVRCAQAAEGSATVVCVASLVFDEAARGPEFRDLKGGDAVAALLPSPYRFEKTSLLWALELDFLDELVSRSRVVEVRRSHDVAADDVADALFRLLAGERS